MMSPSFFILAVMFGYLEIISVSNAAGIRENWGYVNVRKDAYMFWWLYYTDQVDYSNRPLILWIQGGPGGSGTGLGNFLEIGPLDVNLQPRESTWLTRANLLFVDNPVGTGFSYVTNNSSLVRNNAQIAADLLTALRSILEQVPEFKKSPFYIVSESYGGKMTADFALVLQSAIDNKIIECNFKGVSLGDSWISPRDHVAGWVDWLYSMSLLDDTELATLKDYAREIESQLDRSQYTIAIQTNSQMTDFIEKVIANFDWYNVLKNEGPADSGCTRGVSIEDSIFDKLEDLMNGPIRQKLGIIPENVIWKNDADDVFEALEGDYMTDVLSSVENLLNNYSHLDVNVYNGQLDPIINILGVLRWIQRLKWPGLNGFQAAPKQPLTLPGNRTLGFSKSYQQFSLFWIMKAGHYVPYDAPEASLQMLDIILSNKCPLLSLFCA